MHIPILLSNSLDFLSLLSSKYYSGNPKLETSDLCNSNIAMFMNKEFTTVFASHPDLEFTYYTCWPF